MPKIYVNPSAVQEHYNFLVHTSDRKFKKKRVHIRNQITYAKRSHICARAFASVRNNFLNCTMDSIYYLKSLEFRAQQKRPDRPNLSKGKREVQMHQCISGARPHSLRLSSPRNGNNERTTAP